MDAEKKYLKSPDDHAASVELYERYVGQALANPNICTGHATEYALKAWFGERTGITREEIMAAQAMDVAQATVDRMRRYR